MPKVVIIIALYFFWLLVSSADAFICSRLSGTFLGSKRHALFLLELNRTPSPANSGFGAARNVDSKPKKGTTTNNQNNLSNKLRSVSSAHVGAGSKALRQAALAFDRIRKAHGKEACRDVYVRSPLDSPTTFWFVGKVASQECGTTVATTTTASDAIAAPNSPTEMDTDTPSSELEWNDFVAACLSQKRIILEYSKQHLRPHNFGGKFAPKLELWLAPADSEMDVAQNKVTLIPVRGSAADLPNTFSVDTVGYNPEIYIGDEVAKGGLRVERDEQGRPTKPVFQVNEAI
jgi:hypothetical protein